MTKTAPTKYKKDKQKPKTVIEPTIKSNRTKYVVLTFVLLLTVLVYSNSINNKLVNYDDEQYIKENQFIKNLSAKNVSEIFTKFYFSNYHPLTTLAYAIDYHYAFDKTNGNINPQRFHIINLLFHLLNVLLVFELFFLMIKNINLSAIAALLFAIHPMHVESVSWVSERKDVLFTFFFLLSIVTYLRYIRNEKKIKFLIFSFICFVLSLLSKSMAVTLPVILLLIDYYDKGKLTMKNIIQKIHFLALSLLFGLLAIKSQHQGGSVSDLTQSFSIINQIFLLCYSMMFYIIKFVAPFNLSVFYSYPELSGGVLPVPYYLSLIFVLGIIASIIFIPFKFKKELIFGLLFFLITISVVLQIIPVGQAHVAERYTYVPYLGFIFIVIKYINYVKERNIQRYLKLKPYLIVLLSFYMITFSYLTWSRNTIWKDSTSLWKDVILKNPKSYYGYYSLANAFYANGQFDEAIKNYNKSIELQPKFAESYYSRGTIKYKQMNYKEAIDDFSMAIQLKPQYQEAYSNRGTTKLQLQDFSNAKLDFDKAIEINPNDPTEYYNRGNVEYYMQNDSLALKDLNRAIDLKPKYPEAFLNRGLVYYYMKNLNESCHDWEKALEYGNKDALNYLNQFCK